MTTKGSAFISFLNETLIHYYWFRGESLMPIIFTFYNMYFEKFYFCGWLYPPKLNLVAFMRLFSYFTPCSFLVYKITIFYIRVLFFCNFTDWLIISNIARLIKWIWQNSSHFNSLMEYLRFLGICKNMPFANRKFSFLYPVWITVSLWQVLASS